MKAPRKRRATEEPPRDLPFCAHEDCPMPGEYKAPKSRQHLGEYQWLCLDHVREFNKQWDYFEDFTAEDIEAFMKDAMLGHRPTWRIGSDAESAHARLEEAINRFFAGGDEPRRRGSHPDPKIRKALSVMDLDHPTTLPDIKATYKKLVKKYHPDVNLGDKAAEEKFKQITVAYQLLKVAYQ